MVNIVSPNRFYTITRKSYKNIITSVIDLKQISQIDLICFDDLENNRYSIGIFFINQKDNPYVIDIEEGKVGNEEYQKIVTAWTTYKLATEK